MEIWDGYLMDGSLANQDLVRGEPIPKDLYHLVSEILVRHVDGDYLIMQRDFNKPNYGGYYEATAGGSALKGEDKINVKFNESEISIEEMTDMINKEIETHTKSKENKKQQIEVAISENLELQTQIENTKQEIEKVKSKVENSLYI